MMIAENHKRFERLVSLNLEGISSTEEDLELWRIIEENAEAKQEFLQIRNIHYLLKVHCDPMASETAFANRILSSLQPGGMSENDFTTAVQNKLQSSEPRKKTRVEQHPVFKIAASIVIALMSGALYFNLFSQDRSRLPELSVSESVYLAWTYEPQVRKIKKALADFYPSSNAPPYLDSMRDNPIKTQIKQMNQKITRSEILWR